MIRLTQVTNVVCNIYYVERFAKRYRSLTLTHLLAQVLLRITLVDGITQASDLNRYLLSLKFNLL